MRTTVTESRAVSCQQSCACGLWKGHILISIMSVQRLFWDGLYRDSRLNVMVWQSPQLHNTNPEEQCWLITAESRMLCSRPPVPCSVTCLNSALCWNWVVYLKLQMESRVPVHSVLPFQSRLLVVGCEVACRQLHPGSFCFVLQIVNEASDWEPSVFVCVLLWASALSGFLFIVNWLEVNYLFVVEAKSFRGHWKWINCSRRLV